MKYVDLLKIKAAECKIDDFFSRCMRVSQKGGSCSSLKMLAHVNCFKIKVMCAVQMIDNSKIALHLDL